MSNNFIAMIHTNPISVENGQMTVDRKFHIGMLAYAKYLRARVTTVNPKLRPGDRTMDAITVPISELPYGVLAVATDDGQSILPSEMAQLTTLLSASKVVYGAGLGCAPIAKRLGVPYILVLEYDLGTQIVVTTSQVTSPLRRIVRAVRCALDYRRRQIPEIREAYSVHCNGYPIYDAIRSHARQRLLYLDSRMSTDMVISDKQLQDRLNSRAGRPLRMLFSGRYDRIKGADDAVKVAVQCLKRGLDVEMHTYGQGALRDEMHRIAATAVRPERIVIHDPIPYPELVEVSRTFDLFLCCHIQSDPSCTYLESFGAGLPIVGYANRMWRRLCEESKAGLASPPKRLDSVVDDVDRIARDSNELNRLSELAARFARQHSFETEFRKRIDAINATVDAS